MPYTVPNQRVVTVHREPAKTDFLGIKNENWMNAARDLGAHALKLYLYFASNANNYTLALSPAAVRQAIGMARSTYQDQIENLIAKGYLVQTGANSFDFYEVPKPRHGNNQNPVSAVGLNFEECTSVGTGQDLPVQNNTTEDIEINNKYVSTNKTGTNISDLKEAVEVKIPEVKEVRIPVPKLEPKKPIPPKPEKKEFIF